MGLESKFRFNNSYKLLAGTLALVLLVGFTTPAFAGPVPPLPAACPGVIGSYNVVLGTAANEVLNGTPGADYIVGNGGDDQVNAGAGNDCIVTLGGNDTINASAGHNVIIAGAGVNNVTTGGGNDNITTGDNNDTINDSGGGNTIVAGHGVNNVTSGGGHDNITTGDGDDTIVDSGGNNTIVAGQGVNNVTSGGGHDNITTGDNNDTIAAGGGNNTIVAGHGMNTVTTAGGHDNITTGNGNDVIQAGGGNNTVVAGGGSNFISGANGHDNFTSGPGNDVMTLGGGNNQVNAGDGSDVIFTPGNGHDNVINCGPGTDVAFDTGGGNDSYINCENVGTTANPLAFVILNKQVNNEGLGTAGPNDFALTVGGVGVSSGALTPVTIDAATILNETLVSGYAFVSTTGDTECPVSPGGTVTVTANDVVTCTFINVDSGVVPSCTQDEYLSGNSCVALTVCTADQYESVAPTATSDRQCTDLTVCTADQIEAVAPTATSDRVCIDPPCGTGTSFNQATQMCEPNCGPDTELQGDECVSTLVCPDPQPTTASLTVIKDVLNDEGGTALPGDFTMMISPSSNPSQNNFAGSIAGTIVTINPGPYSVSESGPGGYTGTPSSECSGNAIAGESYTCEILNNDDPPKPEPTIEHFLSYNIKENDKQKFRAKYVGLSDQFGSGDFKVKQLYRLLNPVDKNQEGLIDTVTHLVGYKIKQEKGYQNSGMDDQIQVVNQFGEISLDVKKPRMLLLPSAKNHDVTPDPLQFNSSDHYKCYDVRETKNTPKFEDRIVSVYDPNFGETIQHKVDYPKWFCNPVQKTHDKYVGQIINPEANLLCYDVDPVKGEPKHKKTKVYTNNQFGDEGLKTKKVEELCVPSTIVTPNVLIS